MRLVFRFGCDRGREKSRGNCREKGAGAGEENRGTVNLFCALWCSIGQERESVLWGFGRNVGGEGEAVRLICKGKMRLIGGLREQIKNQGRGVWWLRRRKKKIWPGGRREKK